MPKRPLIFSLAGVVIVGATWWWTQSVSELSSQHTIEKSPLARSVGSRDAMRQDRSDPDSPTGAAGPIADSSGPSPVPEFKIELGDPLFNPKDQKEVDWLHRNYYPSKLAQEYADNHPIAAADLNANRPLTAVSILQAQFLGIRDPVARASAVAYLDQAAVFGATYALEALGGMYEHPLARNPVLSEAYYRAGEYLGNWGNQFRVRQFRLNQQESQLAGLMAHQIISQINARRSPHGMPPLVTDPKPGLNEFIQAISLNWKP